MICTLIKYFKVINITFANQKNTFWERMMRKMNYKPGYYLTYFIYCMIPVSIYVTYLWRRRQEDFLPEVDGNREFINSSARYSCIVAIVRTSTKSL